MAVLSVTTTAERIGVSTATVRNWCRAGYLKPLRNNPLGFCETTITEFEATIGSARFTRLQTRANKVRSIRQLGSDSRDEGDELNQALLSALAQATSPPESLSAILFSVAVFLFEQRQHLSLASAGDLSVEPFGFTRRCVQAELLNWRQSLSVQLTPSWYAELTHHLKPFKSTIENHQDLLGSFYQALMIEGSRNRIGSYYTPTSVVIDSIRTIRNPISSFLDPCCGTGRYLIQAAKLLTVSPGQVVGVEIDPLAARIARLNLLLEFPGLQTTPKVYTLDTLAEFATGNPDCSTNAYLKSFDAVATNPPWGAGKNRQQKFPHATQIVSGETFSLFLEKSLSLLRPGGQLSFLLPESFLNIRIHQDVRNLVLNKTQIDCIEPLGRIFSSVFAPVIRLDLSYSQPSSDWTVTLGTRGKQRAIHQHYFQKTPFQFISTSIDATEAALLRRIFSVPHQTLCNHADWALGVVTGDNSKHLSNTAGSGAEPILRGSDLHPYSIAAASAYIKFEPDRYQQVAEEKLYRAREKLIYKFISSRLVFAYDDQRQLTLNSANILIPRLPTHSLKVVLAFFNSRLFQYLFKKQFATHKVLRGDLETFPFPELDQATHTELEGLANEAIRKGMSLAPIDELIFDVFHLTRSEIVRINSAT